MEVVSYVLGDFLFQEKFYWCGGAEVLHLIFSKTWQCSIGNNSKDPVVFGDVVLSPVRINQWCNALKMAESQWILNTTQGGHAQVKMRKWRINSRSFFDSRGIVHLEYVLEGQAVNKEFYLGVLRWLRAAVRKKWPDMWRAKNFLLHHDNAPAHSAHVIHNFLAKSGMLFVHHAPYSLNLAPCNFRLCLKLKTVMEDIMQKSTE